MFKNRGKSTAIMGTIIGASMGIIIGTQMTPMNRRKIMRKARRATESLKDGLDSW